MKMSTLKLKYATAMLITLTNTSLVFADFIMPNYDRTQSTLSKSPIATGFSKRKVVGMNLGTSSSDDFAYSNTLSTSKLVGMTNIERFNLNLEGEARRNQYNSETNGSSYSYRSSGDYLTLNQGILIQDRLSLGFGQNFYSWEFRDNVDRFSNKRGFQDYKVGVGYKLTDAIIIGSSILYSVDEENGIKSDNRTIVYNGGVAYSKLKSRNDNGFAVENIFSYSDTRDHDLGPNAYGSVFYQDTTTLYYQRNSLQLKFNGVASADKSEIGSRTYSSFKLNPTMDYQFSNNIFLGFEYDFYINSDADTDNSATLKSGYRSESFEIGFTLTRNFYAYQSLNNGANSFAVNLNVYNF